MRRTSVRTSSMVLMPRSGRRGVGGDASAGEIEGAEAGGLGQTGGVGIDCAGNLERLFFREGEAKTRAGRVRLLVGSGIHLPWAAS